MEKVDILILFGIFLFLLDGMILTPYILSTNIYAVEGSPLHRPLYEKFGIVYFFISIPTIAFICVLGIRSYKKFLNKAPYLAYMSGLWGIALAVNSIMIYTIINNLRFV